jgi:peptide/nickel transport system substrate-binding protein
MQHRASVATAVCLALALTAACGDSSSSGDADGSTSASGADYAEGGTLTVAIGQDPGNLDPHQTLLSTVEPVNNAVYDNLAAVGPEGLLPNVASEWEVTPTAVTYTVRDDVTCSDGSRLSLDVIKRNFDYILDPANESPLAGSVPPGTTVAVDEAASTLTITSAQPYAYLLEITAPLHLVCEAGLDDRSLLRSGAVGSGPFVLESAKPDDTYVLTAREGYAWGPNGADDSEAEGFPASIELKVVPDETTAANLLLSGDVDAGAFVGPARDRLSGQDGVREEVVASSLISLMFNQNAGRPGADPAVRKALLAATEAEEVGGVMLDDKGQPPEGMTVFASPCQAGGLLEAAIPFEPDEAAAMLEEAGWTEGSGGIREKDGKELSFTFLYATSIGGESAGAAMELIASNWKKAGAEVKITPMTETAYGEALFATGAWDAVILVAGPSNPADALPLFAGPTPAEGGQNFAGIQNETFAERGTSATQTPGEEGCEAWYEGERALLENGDLHPLTALTYSVFGKGVEFEVNVEGELMPTSYRVLK